MRLRASLILSAVLLVATMGMTVGCSKAPNDSQISSQLQDKLNTDSGLQGKQLNTHTHASPPIRAEKHGRVSADRRET